MAPTGDGGSAVSSGRGSARRQLTSGQTSSSADPMGSESADQPCWKKYLFLIITVESVILGIIGALILRAVDSDQLTLVAGFPGKLFLKSLRALILPLLFGNVITGVASLRNTTKSSNIASRTLIYYACTTVGAVFLGIILATTIQPGQSATTTTSSAFADKVQPRDEGSVPTSTLDAVLSVFLKLIPENIVQSAAETDMLGIIVVAIVMGYSLSVLEEKGKALMDVFTSLNELVMFVVNPVVVMAPFGIASLVAARIAQAEDLVEVLTSLGSYVATVATGLAIYAFVILPATFWFVTKQKPFIYMRNTAEALLTALGTASSSASLPLTLKCATSHNGISESIANFVIPLGATVNMNGTALYEAVAVFYIAQVRGVEFDFVKTLIVAFSATLAAVGASGIPEAGLVTLMIALEATGLDPDMSDVSYIFAIDFALDRMRTSVNVLSDAYAAGIVQYLHNKDVIVETIQPQGSGNGIELDEFSGVNGSRTANANANANANNARTAENL